MIRMHSSSHGQTVLQFFIDYGMTTDNGGSRFVHLVLTAAQDLGEYLDRQRSDGKSDDAERRQRLAAHGVHVGERIRRGNLPELVRVVDDRGKEVDGLDEGQTIGQPKDSRVIEGLSTNENSGIGSRVQRRESAGQVTRTQLGGSTRAAGELSQSKCLFAKVGHGALVLSTMES
jgi:hypothetical protein